jgi:hypothetical protein
MQDEQRFAFNFVLAQWPPHVRKCPSATGLRKHGKAAEAALMAEFSQLEDLDVYEALDPTTLNKEHKRRPLFEQSTFSKKSEMGS